MDIEKIEGVPHPHRQIEEVKSQTHKLHHKEKKDKIDISPEAKKISKYIEMIKNMPEVREEKIKAIEGKLARGEYKSEKIIEETIKRLTQEIL